MFICIFICTYSTNHKTECSMGTGWVYLYRFCTRITKRELPFIGRVLNLTTVKMYTYVHTDNDDNVKFTVEVDTYVSPVYSTLLENGLSKFHRVATSLSTLNGYEEKLLVKYMHFDSDLFDSSSKL